MSNLSLFAHSLISYLVIFVVFAVCIIIAILVGIKCRKIKNAKDEVKEAADNIEAAAKKETA